MIKFEDATPEVIQDWKAKFGANSLHQITVEQEDEKELNFILRIPTRSVLDATTNAGVKKDYTAANKILISNCVLAGDEQAIENDGGVYSAILEELTKLQKKKTATIKKL